MEIGEEVALLEILRDFVHQKTSTSGDFTHSDGSVKKMWRMHITGRICKKKNLQMWICRCYVPWIGTE